MLSCEKELKRFVKRKVSYNLGLMVKFLITGSLAFSLTACGGGGGDSSSDGGGNTNVYNGKNITLGQSFNGKKVEISSGRLEKYSTVDQSGISGRNSTITSDLEIVLAGRDNTGIEIEGGKLTNTGDIAITGKDSCGIDSEDATVVNKGNIKVRGTGVAGIASEISTVAEGKKGYTITNDGDIFIDAKAEGYGIISEVEEDIKIGVNDEMPHPRFIGADVINNRNITVYTETIMVTDDEGPSEYGDAIGIVVENANVTNNGKIEIGGKFESGIGIDAEISNSSKDYLIKNSKNGIIKVDGRRSSDVTCASGIHIGTYNGVKVSVLNEGRIEVLTDIREDDDIDGIFLSGNGEVENRGTITVKSNGGAGIFVEPNSLLKDRPKAINRGTINVEGYNVAGMYGSGKGTVISNEKSGIINIKGNGSIGMTADENSLAINKGTINVGKGAKAGMLAINGGKIDNEGTINVDKSHGSDFVAMQTEYGGKILNKGTINTGATVVINTKSTYAVGLDADGSHGKLSAKNFAVRNGATLKVDMTDEAKLSTETRNVVVADSQEKNIEEGVNFTTNSILHSAKEIETNDGREVVEVKKTAEIKDFAKNETKEVAGLLDNLIANRAAIDPLTVIASRLDSKERLNAAIDRFAGVEHLNLPRQMFNIDNTFRKYDTSVISTLDNYDYNFELIGNFSKDDSKEGINGYENNMTGFNGGAKLAKGLYGTLGYGHSDIDYKDVDSTEKIQTIHAGLYQDNKINEYNVRVGVLGEYNFHEMDRETLGDTADSKFNSYVVGARFEASRRFGNEFYVEPALGVNLSYGNREAFDENGAEDFNLKVSEEDYTSILPEVGVKVGRIFNNFEVYANAKYSYELGDVDKDMTIEILNEKARVRNNDMEEGRFDVSAGMKANFNQIDVNLEVGKEFRDVDRNYVKAGISYTF